MRKRSNAKIHVMHILPSLETGGMENGVVNLANRIDKNKFTISICCLNGLGPLTERLQDNIKVINLNQKPGKAWILPVSLSKIFRQHTVDIIHTHNSFAGIYGILGGKLFSRCIILHGEHGMIDFMDGYRKRLKKFICSFTDRVTTVSEGLKEDVHAMWGIPEEKIVVIQNGVDREKFRKINISTIRDIKKSLNIMENEIILGTVGRLSDQKNYPFLLQAIKEIRSSDRKVKLVIVGEGPLRSELERMVDRLSIESNVIFLGERKDIPELLSIMDIFLFPAYKGEGIANVLLEAMSIGVPVVSSDIKGNIEVVENDKTGFIFPSNNLQIFINKINQLIDNSQLRSNFSTASIDRINKMFSLERMINDYEECYLKVMNFRVCPEVT